MMRFTFRRAAALLGLGVAAVPLSSLAIPVSATPARAQATKVEGPALPYASTPDLRAATVARAVRDQRATNPIAAAETAREMAQHDYDTIFRGFLDGTPLRPDDAGDVLTAFIALQWMVANDATVEPSAAALRAIRTRFVAPMAERPPLSQPATRAAFAEQVKLRAVLHHAGWQAAKRLGVLPRFLAGLSNEFIPVATLRNLALTEDGLVPKDRAGRAAPKPPPVAESPSVPDARPAPSPAPSAPDAAGPPRHAANWDQVEGVYFRSTTGFGVGGLMTIDFEPLIFLRDGTYYEVADTALEDVDLAAERAARPKRFGRWSAKGAGFVLTDARGRANDYALGDGSFFRAFPAALASGWRGRTGGCRAAATQPWAATSRSPSRAATTSTRTGVTAAAARSARRIRGRAPASARRSPVGARRRAGATPSIATRSR